MAISVDWPSKVINVPKTDLTWVGPGEVYELNLNDFRLALKDLEDDETGIAYLDTHEHVAPFDLGAFSLARIVYMINGYTCTFEDGMYAVNLQGANTNLHLVTNVNSVSIRPNNSVGLADTGLLLRMEQVLINTSYSGIVHIDTSGDGMPGAVLGVNGTPDNPTDNLADALSLCSQLGVEHLHVKGTVVVGATDVSDFVIDGSGSIQTDILVLAGANTSGCALTRLTLTGTVVSTSGTYVECVFYNTTGFAGIATDCGFQGTITLGAAGPATGVFLLKDGVFIDAPTIFDLVGPGRVLKGGTMTGSVEIRNAQTGAPFPCLVQMTVMGTTHIASSCTGGTILVRGVNEVTDDSAGAAIIDTAVSNPRMLQNFEDGGFTPERAARLDYIEPVVGVETTAQVGSTATTVFTPLTHADNYFKNMQMFIEHSSGVVARAIDGFSNLNGAIGVQALPFTPDPGDRVVILRRAVERVRDKFDPTGLFK